MAKSHLPNRRSTVKLNDLEAAAPDGVKQTTQREAEDEILRFILQQEIEATEVRPKARPQQRLDTLDRSNQVARAGTATDYTKGTLTRDKQTRTREAEEENQDIIRLGREERKSDRVKAELREQLSTLDLNDLEALARAGALTDDMKETLQGRRDAHFRQKLITRCVEVILDNPLAQTLFSVLAKQTKQQKVPSRRQEAATNTKLRRKNQSTSVTAEKEIEMRKFRAQTNRQLASLQCRVEHLQKQLMDDNREMKSKLRVQHIMAESHANIVRALNGNFEILRELAGGQTYNEGTPHLTENSHHRSSMDWERAIQSPGLSVDNPSDSFSSRSSSIMSE